VLDRDAVAVREVGQPARDRVVIADRAVLNHAERQDDRHRLGDRGHAESRVGRDRHPELAVGEPEGALEHDLPMAGDQQPAGEIAALDQRPRERIERAREALILGRRGRAMRRKPR
jgi:hypothetical protein